MRTILSPTRRDHVTRASIWLITLALIAGMVGCGGDGGEYTLTVEASTVEGGTVTDLTNASPYAAGTVVTIQAVAAADYQFISWSATAGTFGNATAATTTFTMPAQNVTVTASFGRKIRNWRELDRIRDNLGGTYILMNDLDSTTTGYEELASASANAGKGWQPIGNDTEGFAGTFDGQGYEVRDLFIDRPDEDDVGLFGRVDDGVINDVGVVNITVVGSEGVGGLVGSAWGHSFGELASNCYSTGNVTGDSEVGGLVGFAMEWVVTNSHSTSSVSGHIYVGGLVGVIVGNVIDSYSTGDVDGEGGVGGLVGGLVGPTGEEGTVINSYSAGKVNGHQYTGGLLGLNEEGDVIDSYSTGSVTGGNYTGGLVGWNGPSRSTGAIVANSYFSGSITGANFTGGLVGWNEGNVTDSYCASNVTGTNLVGGLVGWGGGSVTDSHSTGSATGNSCVGGLIGVGDGLLTNCYSANNVSGDRHVGGLVGAGGWYSFNATNSYATGSVSGNLCVGGLVGSLGVGINMGTGEVLRICGGAVNNCYATGSVSGNSSVGGLLGENDGAVSNSYSTGNVAGYSQVGGLVGYTWCGTVTNSLWDTETSGQSGSDGGTGKTTAEMKDVTTFSGATWDIVAVANPGTRSLYYIWNIVDDATYPFLSWQPVS